MTPLFLAIRAVSSEFARRIYIPLMWLIGGALVALLITGGWLTTLSPWWWLLFVPIILVLVLFIVVSSVIGIAIHILRPIQSPGQRKKVASLVDKLQEVSEALQMPKVVLIYQLAKDTIVPNGQGFVGKMTSHASTLKPDFQKIITSFK